MMGVDLPAELTRMVFQELEEGLIHCDLEGRIMDINRGAEDILGLESADFGDAGGRLGEAGILRREDLKPVAAGLKILNAPAVIRRPDGRDRRILISAFPVTGEGGEVTGILVTLKPAPHPGSAAGDWKRWSAVFMEQVARDLHEGVGFTDLEGRFKFCNQALSDIVGMEPEKLRNRFLPSCIKPAGRPLLFMEVLETTIRQESWEGDLEIEAGGSKKIILVTTALVRDETGENAGISLVVRDVSDHQRLEEDMEEARHELSIIHGMLGNTSNYYDFAGTMSETLSHILHALHSEAGAVLLWDRGEGCLRIHSASGLTYRGTVRLEEEAGRDRPLFQVFRDNQPWMVQDAIALPDRMEVAGKRGRLRSLLAAPVRSGTIALGVIVVGHKQAGAFTPRHAEMLSSMASRVGLVFELARTVNSLQEKVEELGAERDLSRFLLTCLPGMAFQLDGEGRLISSNRRAQQLLGRAEEDLMGKAFTRLICARDRGAWRRLAAEAAEGECFNLEACLLDKKKNELAVELTGRLAGPASAGGVGLLVMAKPVP